MQVVGYLHKRSICRSCTPSQGRSSNRPAETPVIHPGEEAGPPYLGHGFGWLPFPFRSVSETNQERHATQVKMRQSLTFAACVNRLLVR